MGNILSSIEFALKLIFCIPISIFAFIKLRFNKDFDFEFALSTKKQIVLYLCILIDFIFEKLNIVNRFKISIL